MNKLMLVSIFFTAITAEQVFAIEKNNLHQVSFLNKKDHNNFTDFNSKLLYNLSQNEINNMSESYKKTEAQELYDFMKLSFNIISNNREKLYELFISTKSDIYLINFCKQILSDINNYKHLGSNYKQLFNSEIKTLNSNKYEYNKYINDIIHNNIYSAIFDVLIEKYKLDNNCFRNFVSDYISNNVIPEIFNNIKNKYRKEIINSALKIFLLYEVPDPISIDNYTAYIMRTNGIHRDNYNNYTNHIIFHGLSFNSFIQIINNLNHDDLKVELETFRTLVRDGYITNPYIVDYINDRC